MPEKLFRDPLYDYIAVDKDSWLLKLINCPEVQRLRYIKHLGLSHFTYPGSTHSRFSHSLGVLHLMRECLGHLKQDFRSFLRRLDQEALLAAALLHDIGHSPLSHATESIFGDHEKRAVEIIESSDSKVNNTLRKRAITLPSRVSELIAKESVAPLWQKSLISSQLDMDRLDYLRRDSLFSGAEYGNFDWFRIIHTMQVQEKVIKGKQKDTFVVWPDKTKYALEEYIFARFYMYQNVYFHHTTRGFEGLVQRVLKRAQRLAKQSKNFASEFLPPIKILLGGKAGKDPAKFRNLTDHMLLAQITMWQNAKDKTLSDLAKRLLARKGISWKEVVSGTPFQMTAKIERVRKYLRRQGKDPNYYFIEDSAKASAYNPYRSVSAREEQSSVTSIILCDESYEGGLAEISDVPDLQQRLRAITAEKSPAILRYYFPKEHETQIKKLLS